MYPKMLYRGSFASREDLEAAWNSQNGIEQKTVNSAQEEVAAIKAGYVDEATAMVRSAPAAGSATASAAIPVRKGSKDEPLSGDR